MDGPAEQQVSADADNLVVAAAQLMTDGQQICERLSRMFVAAVAGIDNGHIRNGLRDKMRRTFARVAEHRRIRVATYRTDRVRQGLAFCEDAFGSENPITWPPSRSIAASKLKRVRVEGS